MLRILGVAALSAALAACGQHPGRTVPITDGRSVLARMREAYDGRWYQTLTFTQSTHFIRRDGTRDSATWYESVKGGDRLRIDIGPPSQGNGALYRGDSLISMRNGQVARRIALGNPFLPLIMGVYLQPLDTTVRQVTGFGFTLDHVREATWEGRPAWVVGGTSDADTLAPQFWVDRERLVLLRMKVGIGAPNTPLADISLGGYVETGGGWLATRVTINNNGQVQTEDYHDWRPNVPLSDALFDPAQWTTAPHWARP